MKGQAYAVTSGLIAAVASLCGKYAVARNEAKDLCEITLRFWELYSKENQVFCDQYLLLWRGGFFVLMFLFNCVMWTTFTKALRFTSTSLEATIINTASNFFFTVSNAFTIVFSLISVFPLW
ncbi:hypothetical protein Avbf_03931 [Armadillidium vulgare]|nr:hypothetical protein Avbf_03931 [Armadillidium vulgare]